MGQKISNHGGKKNHKIHENSKLMLIKRYYLDSGKASQRVKEGICNT